MASSAAVYGAYIFEFITFLIFCRLLYIEWRTCKVVEARNHNKVHSVAQKGCYFTILVVLTILPVLEFIGEALPICKYRLKVLWLIFFYISGVAITFYQITRLYHSFSSKHSSQYAYSNYTIISLYVNGFVWTIYILIISTYYYFIDDKFELYIDQNQCFVDTASDHMQYTIIGSIWYYSLDWTVLGLYIFKVLQIHHQFVHGSALLNSIKFRLLKITILTIAYQINTICFVVVYNFVILAYDLQGILSSYLFCTEYLICVYIVRLMPEHNHSKYMKWMKCMNKSGLFCCCRTLINDALVDDEKEQAGMRENTQTQQTDTKTDIALSQVIAK